MFTSEHWKPLCATSATDLRFSAGLLAAFALTLGLCVRVLEVWTSDQNYRSQAVNSLGPEIRVLIAGRRTCLPRSILPLSRCRR
jgi:hypothetical protein